MSTKKNIQQQQQADQLAKEVFETLFNCLNQYKDGKCIVCQLKYEDEYQDHDINCYIQATNYIII
jgi:hypothetical protein